MIVGLDGGLAPSRNPGQIDRAECNGGGARTRLSYSKEVAAPRVRVPMYKITEILRLCGRRGPWRQKLADAQPDFAAIQKDLKKHKSIHVSAEVISRVEILLFRTQVRLKRDGGGRVLRRTGRSGGLAGADAVGEFDGRQATLVRNQQARQPLRPDAAGALRPLGTQDACQAHGRAGEMAAVHAQDQRPACRDRGAGRPPGGDRLGPADQRPEARSAAAACASGLRARRLAQLLEGSLIASAEPNQWTKRSHPRFGNLSATMPFRGRSDYEHRGARSPSWPGTSMVPLRGRIYWRTPPFIGSGAVDNSGANHICRRPLCKR